MTQSKRILCLFDYLCKTGFSTVSTNIIKNLRQKFGDSTYFDIVAINYYGDPVHDGNVNIISGRNSISAKMPDGEVRHDDFGRFTFMKLLETNEYDLVFIIQDLAVIVPIIPKLKKIQEEKRSQNRKQFKSVYYFPVDCELRESDIKGIDFFDSPVTYTNWGREMIRRVSPVVARKVSVIPHGTNTKDFYPTTRREYAPYFEKLGIDMNNRPLIISNINRNQSRKDIPTTIFAFQHLKKIWAGPEKLFLYLHMVPKDPMGWDLQKLLSFTDLKEGVDYALMPEEYWAGNGVPVDLLNEIYNVSDVTVTTTLAEGWGLSVTESMAAGTPVICPLNTSLIEITDFGRRAFVVDDFVPFSSVADSCIRDQVDYLVFAETMNNVLENRHSDDVQSKINLALNYARENTWEKICKSWYSVVKALI